MQDYMVSAVKKFLFEDISDISLLFLLDELLAQELITEADYHGIKPYWNESSHKQMISEYVLLAADTHFDRFYEILAKRIHPARLGSLLRNTRFLEATDLLTNHVESQTTEEDDYVVALGNLKLLFKDNFTSLCSSNNQTVETTKIRNGYRIQRNDSGCDKLTTSKLKDYLQFLSQHMAFEDRDIENLKKLAQNPIEQFFTQKVTANQAANTLEWVQMFLSRCNNTVIMVKATYYVGYSSAMAGNVFSDPDTFKEVAGSFQYEALENLFAKYPNLMPTDFKPRAIQADPKRRTIPFFHRKRKLDKEKQPSHPMMLTGGSGVTPQGGQGSGSNEDLAPKVFKTEHKEKIGQKMSAVYRTIFGWK